MSTDPKMLDFSGKTILVTGGARGIGAAVVRQFIDCGANVVINHLRDVGKGAGDAKRLAAYAAEKGRRSFVIAADIGLPREVRRMFQAFTDEGINRIDHVVLNAATTPFKPIIEMRPKDWQSLFETNIAGNVECVTAVLPLIPRGGRIVAISSLGSLYVLPNYPLGVAKSALETLVRYLDCELYVRGIGVNGICAGFTNTDTMPFLRENMGDYIAHFEANGRRWLLEPDEVASIALFLCSSLSSGICGATILADAGARR
jgi:enoyl-[acyl-carrier protein] reductase III